MKKFCCRKSISSDKHGNIIAEFFVIDETGEKITEFDGDDGFHSYLISIPPGKSLEEELIRHNRAFAENGIEPVDAHCIGELRVFMNKVHTEKVVHCFNMKCVAADEFHEAEHGPLSFKREKKAMLKKAMAALHEAIKETASDREIPS